MAEKASTIPYVPGGSETAKAANAEYEAALQEMLTTLDTRKSRLFDPQLLAMAQGFLSPSGGSFFNAAGNAAGEMNKAQLEQEKEAREIAQAKLGMIGQKLGITRQQEADTMLADFLKNAEPKFGSPGVQGAGMPGGAGGAGGNMPQGIRISPGSPSLMTPQQYVALARRMDPNASMAEILKKAGDMQRENIKVTDKGTYNIEQGTYYPAPGTETRSVPILGQKGTYPVSEQMAVRLFAAYDQGVNNNDWSEYSRLSKIILEGPPTAPAAAPAGAPSGVPSGAPAAPARPAGGTQSIQEQEIDKARRTRLAEQEVLDAAKMQATIPDKDAAARDLYSLAGRVEQRAKESQNFVGIFDRPGLMPAIGKLLSGGFRTKEGSFDAGNFESAVRQALPDITDKDIKNINLIAGDLADIELAYTSLRMGGTGPLTEGERAIVRRIGGSVSENPASLLAKMRLIKMKSQFDMDTYAAWNAYKEQNPDSDWSVFARKELPQMRNDYNIRLAQAFKIKPAVPSAAKPSSSKSEGVNRAREQVNKLLGG